MNTDSTYDLHLIASTPSHAGAHADPDSTARLLGSYSTRDAAVRAGREYLAAHPDAWVQVQGAGEISDVTR